MSISLVPEKRNIASGQRKSFAKLPEVLEIPNLIKVQLDSFRWFQEEGLKELLQEVSPIYDFTGTRLELHFAGYEFRQPPFSVDQCRQRDMAYAAPLYVRAKLLVKETGEIKEQEIFFGDFPLMTDKGTFIISGAERVVVNQLLRSPGIYFSLQEDPTSGRELCSAKLIPEHGAWLEFETSNRDVIFVKVDGKRKIPVVILLRAIGYDGDSELLELFQDVETSSDHSFIQSTIEREPSIKTREEALIDIYKRLRPGEPPTVENAQGLLNNLFFNPRRYDLGRVGRYKLNNRLGVNVDERRRCLNKEDFIEIVKRIIKINNGIEEPDDIDHLRNRRVRTAGHLIQNQFRIGLLRLERTIKERMSIVGPEAAIPSTLINNRPIVAAMREFFGGSQLSQFMDQTNPLAELTHKRRLSAMGPGGLSRERAGFDVRDVHHSHYGKICPIETPEGPNIGLIGSLATYASVNDYGFIQTPYRKVIHEVPNKIENLIDRTLLEDITDSSGKVIAAKKSLLTKDIAKKIASLSRRNIKIVPFVSDKIEYLTADEEERYTIAQANALLSPKNEFVEDRIGVIRGGKYLKEPTDKIDFMDVSPKQVFSVTTSLIPFLEHDDANRALMGSNMQRQAVPLLRPEAPLIATGMEKEVAKYSGQVIFAREDGKVVSVDNTQVTIVDENGNEHAYPLMKFVRTNQGTCVNQRPVVSKGDKVKKGQVIVDGSATDHGELALGQNILCAFMSWRGY
ncbi:MAG: DNA-directed RNA polymerase subunit beta, partial [Chloroflexota bacterium]